jgi:hypothetical protein
MDATFYDELEQIFDKANKEHRLFNQNDCAILSLIKDEDFIEIRLNMESDPNCSHGNRLTFNADEMKGNTLLEYILGMLLTHFKNDDYWMKDWIRRTETLPGSPLMAVGISSGS